MLRSSHTVRRFLTTSVVGCALWARSLAAQEAHGAADRVPSFLVAGRLGAGLGLNQGGFNTRVDGAYRLVPSVLVGASFEMPITSGRLDGDACGDAGVECVNWYYLVGARTEFQPWADSIVGPWLGAELGVLAPVGYNSKSLIPALGADAGVEVRPIRAVGIGAYLSTTFLTADPYVYDPYPRYQDGMHLELGSVGLRVAGRFDLSSGE